MWKLIGPNGQTFEAETALKCASLEIASRRSPQEMAKNLMPAVDDLLAYGYQLKEARRLLKYATTYSNGRHLFAQSFLDDTKRLLDQPDIECP